MFDLVCFPTLAQSVISTRSNFTAFNMFVAGGTPGSSWGFDVAALGQSYSSYRIVGWGVRVRATASFNSPGEFLTGVMPLNGMVPFGTNYRPAVLRGTGASVDIPTYTGLAGPQDTLELYLDALGLPYQGAGNFARIDSAKIPSMPNHGTMSLAQAAARGLHVRSFPFEPTAYNFRKVAYKATGTDSADIWAGGDTQQYGVDLSPWRLPGFESIVIAGGGFTPSTTIGTLEILYHVEVTYNPNLAMIARAAGSTLAGGSPTDHLNVVHSLKQVPRISFSDVVQKGEDMVLGYVEDRVGALASAGLDGLYGAMSRLLSAGA